MRSDTFVACHRNDDKPVVTRKTTDARELIGAARAAGISWAELAPAMGVTSRQAAERRYLRVRRGAQDDATLRAEVGAAACG